MSTTKNVGEVVHTINSTPIKTKQQKYFIIYKVLLSFHYCVILELLSTLHFNLNPTGKPINARSQSAAADSLKHGPTTAACRHL